MIGKPKRNGKPQWIHVDLHLHTPGSADYQEPTVTYLDILRRAEVRGLDVIAFTDHNTVAGYRNMMAEVEQLALLERLDRATPEERRRLAEYRRLLDKILVLPGFEFTATFGFHVLGIFSPQMPIRQIEHILLSLNIPPNAIDEGNSNVGASSDVLAAYRAINDAGGIVIAAHVNSSHGVAMRGFDFGGQTRIAYTQDPYLHALEVTDLERRGRSMTARFFDGSRSEYPRRMRCIQGSDAHRLSMDERNEKYLGIGDRTTEIFVEERSFEAIREIFQSADHARSRPYRGPAIEVYDYVQSARENGSNATQAFHVTLKDKLDPVLSDICAMSNSEGGTLYLGVSADPTQPPVGVDNLSRTIESLQNAIASKIAPTPEVAIDALESQSRIVVRVQVARGNDLPYAIDGSKIYIRTGAETTLARRDEIVQLVTRNLPVASAVSVPANVATNAQADMREPNHRPILQAQAESQPSAPPLAQAQDQSQAQPRPVRPLIPGKRPGFGRPSHLPPEPVQPRETPAESVTPVTTQPNADDLPVVLPPDDFGDTSSERRPANRPPPRMGGQRTNNSRSPQRSQFGQSSQSAPAAPRPVTREVLPGAGGVPETGVEIVGTETRKGEQFHIMRDLRNGKLVKNVTRSSARQLWQYAIIEREMHPVDSGRITWNGDFGLIRRYRRGDLVRYDLAMRDRETVAIRVFYGVTDEGLKGEWLQFAADDVPIEVDTGSNE